MGMGSSTFVVNLLTTSDEIADTVFRLICPLKSERTFSRLLLENCVALRETHTLATLVGIMRSAAMKRWLRRNLSLARPADCRCDRHEMRGTADGDPFCR